MRTRAQHGRSMAVSVVCIPGVDFSGAIATLVDRGAGRGISKQQVVDDLLQLQKELTCTCPGCAGAMPMMVFTRRQLAQLYDLATGRDGESLYVAAEEMCRRRRVRCPSCGRDSVLPAKSLPSRNASAE